MSPLLVTALRRMAWYAVGLALVLVLVFKVLPAFGILGPSPEDHVSWASDALETARAYGARPGETAFAEAAAGVERARSLLLAGRSWEARRIGIAARARAVEAQRAALAAREQDRRRARRIVDEIDATLNELENLYAQVQKRAGKDKASELLPLMKTARQTGAALFLAFEEQGYGRVLDEEAQVKAKLAEAKATLEAAGKKR